MQFRLLCLFALLVLATAAHNERSTIYKRVRAPPQWELQDRADSTLPFKVLILRY